MENVSNRKISSAPAREEIRLHSLDMAVRSAQLMGRADGVLQLAEQYFDWITKPGLPPESKLAAAEPMEAGGAHGAEPPLSFDDPLMPKVPRPGSDMPPASVRQVIARTDGGKSTA